VQPAELSLPDPETWSVKGVVAAYDGWLEARDERTRPRRKHHRDVLLRQWRGGFGWPDGGTTPFRGEKNENWEGGYRVPCAIRWPGVIKPGTVLNDLFAHEDMIPTIMAAAGVSDVKEQLLKGMEYPPSQKVGSFSLDQVLEKLQQSGTGGT
jgi:arylsulfatase A-like enzyme